MCLGMNEFSAKETVNNLDILDLEKIFKFFGDEIDAKKIAINIGIERKKEEINSGEFKLFSEKNVPNFSKEVIV